MDIPISESNVVHLTYPARWIDVVLLCNDGYGRRYSWSCQRQRPGRRCVGIAANKCILLFRTSQICALEEGERDGEQYAKRVDTQYEALCCRISADNIVNIINIIQIHTYIKEKNAERKRGRAATITTTSIDLDMDLHISLDISILCCASEE